MDPTPKVHRELQQHQAVLQSMVDPGDRYPALARLQARGHFGIKKGLDNIRALFEAIGHPESGYPVVLIAGTNGKGSTGAFMAHVLKAAGLTVGWTTSPHLVSPNERVWVDGRPIGLAALELLLSEAFEAEVRAGVEATYFELMVLAATLAFRMTGVEVALVEVGMGGRWDATNALDPLVTVLTNVGLDHQNFLGPTREAIAREKLCTARTGRPLVLGPTLDPAWVRPLLECEPMVCTSEALRPQVVKWDHSVIRGMQVGLPGAHQAENLATALQALAQLRRMGFPVPDAAVARGVEEALWPGRIWAVPDLEEVWMDGAHNPDGARVLADHALACCVRPHLYVGGMGDKDLAGVAAELRRMDPLSVTFVHGQDPRYADARRLREAWGLDAEMLDVKTAAMRLQRPADGLRLVTGSLYLLGDLLKALGISL